jgi:hypothetical protein
LLMVRQTDEISARPPSCLHVAIDSILTRGIDRRETVDTLALSTSLSLVSCLIPHHHPNWSWRLLMLRTLCGDGESNLERKVLIDQVHYILFISCFILFHCFYLFIFLRGVVDRPG